MRFRSVHVVFGIAVLAALGLLVFLVVREVPGGEGKRGHSTFSASNRSTVPAEEEKVECPLFPVPAEATVPHYRYKVVKSYPHDRRAFTQGLVYEDGVLYEGTGLYGRSALTQRDLRTGQVLKTLRLGDQYFGEGITLFGDRLIQLTWQSNVGFLYDKKTFTPQGEFRYPGEGWGLTHDGRRLILSDGTATLRFLDPNTCAETGRLVVRDRGRPVPSLNELEFVPNAPPTAQSPPAVKSEESPTGAWNGGMGFQPMQHRQDADATGARLPQAREGFGLIYANIWPTDRIAIIDPASGRVTGWIDLSGLYTPPAEEQGESVLNGIAYLPETGRLLVTGKYWPRMYEIELVPASP